MVCDSLTTKYNTTMELSERAVSTGLGLPKSAHACDFCRLKKIRCTGNTPCTNCLEHKQECNFTAKRRRQKRQTRTQSPSLARRLAHFEVLLQAAQEAKRASEIDGFLSKILNDQGSNKPDKPPMQHSFSESPLTHRNESDPRIIHQMSVSANSNPHEHEVTSGFHTVKAGIAYWGPRTSMAICSTAGVAWVKERINYPDFQASATRYTRDITKRLKLDKRLSGTRKEEPLFHEALQYANGMIGMLSSSGPTSINRHSIL